MQIIIDPSGWGEARIVDIHTLLVDVADQLFRHFVERPQGRIRIEHCPPDDATPIVLYRKSPDDDFTVRLNTQDRQWAQYSYQFAHELCHILSGYEKLKLRKNQWFQEVLCELASLFTLNQMAHTWLLAPPYAHWSDYAANLKEYVAETISLSEQLPANMNLPEWFNINEPNLRDDPYQRPRNTLMSIRLLPLFEQMPTNWRPIQYMPNTDEPFKVFLTKWHAACPADLKPLVLMVAEVFGIDILDATVSVNKNEN